MEKNWLQLGIVRVGDHSYRKEPKLILESLGSCGRMNALEVHRNYLGEVVGTDDDHPLAPQLRQTEAMIKEMGEIVRNPKGHWVEVLRSRMVEPGSVGKVVYADHGRNHCRVEFGIGERVSCALGNVEVIDWNPLPSFIPMPGTRIQINESEGDLIALEWAASQVRVVPVNRPAPIEMCEFWVARQQIRQINMIS
jgi:hypothetical protein